MAHTDWEWGERFVRLTLAMDEHMPGYVDAYFGPEEWKAQAKQDGKLPLSNLAAQVGQLAEAIAQANDMDPQRRDYLARHLTAMQMSVRLLAGERVSLAEEVEALYDVRPSWRTETEFEEAHRLLDDVLPAGAGLKERMLEWDHSLEIPPDTIKALLPTIIKTLRHRTAQKLDLPEGETFSVEFVSNQPWSAYNWYLGNFRSRIDLNLDLPIRVGSLPALLAHEAYPGHHTDLSMKEKILVRGQKHFEFTVNLLNAPSAVMAEGIATTARKNILSDEELADWLREELLPAAGLDQIDPQRILAVGNAGRKMDGLNGNAAFMLHDQHKSQQEVSQYLQEYGLSTEQEATHMISFLSNPLYRSYIFTYHVGFDLLEELFQYGDRDTYLKRMIEEPVTPGLVRQWIADFI